MVPIRCRFNAGEDPGLIRKISDLEMKVPSERLRHLEEFSCEQCRTYHDARGKEFRSWRPRKSAGGDVDR